MALVIKNGELVTSARAARGDVRIIGEQIQVVAFTESGDSPLDVEPSDEVIDASGQLVFPGGLDPQVHLELASIMAHAATLGACINVHAEFDDSVYDAPGFAAAAAVLSPPIRPKQHQAALWPAPRDNTLKVVATDHCPFNLCGQKELGRDDFRKIPSGTARAHDRAPGEGALDPRGVRARAPEEAPDHNALQARLRRGGPRRSTPRCWATRARMPRSARRCSSARPATVRVPTRC